MRREERDPMFPLIILAIALLALLVVGLVLFGYGLLTKGQSVPLSPTPTLVQVESSPDLELSPTLATTSTPNLNYGLSVGVIDQEPDCRFFTDVMVRLSEQYLKESIRVVPFDSAESLFNALGTNTINVTLCYTDPTHRSLLRQHVGHINMLANFYWQEGNQRLQVMIPAEYVVALPKEKPCLLDLWKSLRFSAENSVPTNVDDWIAKNQSEIMKWVDCQP